MSKVTHTGYRMEYKYRGQAIIIVNETFDDPGYDRPGAGADLRNMTYLFKSLDFFVRTYQNLPGAKMKEKILKAFSDKKKNKHSDCFVLVISTHGEEELDKDKKGVYDKMATVWRHGVLGTDNVIVYVDEITAMIEDTKDDVNGLNGKPKLFFIQACRSQQGYPGEHDVYDRGLMVNVLTATGSENSNSGNGDGEDAPDSTGEDRGNVDNKGLTSRTESSNDCPETLPDFGSVEDIYSEWDIDTDAVKVLADEITRSTEAEDIADAGGSKDTGKPLPPTPFDVVPIHCPKDCLIVYPVQPHKIALRNQVKGSWLLQYLRDTKNLAILLEGHGLMQYLTSVAADMAKYDSGIIKEKAKMAATIVHRLTGDVKFVKKTNKTIMAKLVDYFKKRSGK